MIIISGASRGLGKTIREHLKNHGFPTLGLSREISKDSTDIKCDVTDYASIRDAKKEIKSRNINVDALVNVAGIASMNLVLTSPKSIIDEIIKVNLLGTIYLNKEFASLMIRKNKGRIINFSSIGVKLAISGEAVYVASKAAVESFSRTFARELSEFNITVNCISPGPIKTDLLRGITDEKIKKITDQQIFRRDFKPLEVAEIVELLLNENAKNISGQVINVGGA